MRLLWIIKPDVNAGIHNGANLRFYHCGRELRQQQHNVYFLACRYFFQDNNARESLLADLKRQGSADECFTIADDVLATGSAWKRPFEIQTTRRRNEARRTAANYLKTLIDEHGIDGCIISDRSLLFLIDELRSRVPVIIDWIDSFTLYFSREALTCAQEFRLKEMRTAVRTLVSALIQEWNYGRRADRNLTVSPVDKRWFDRINRVPERNEVVLNGISLPSPRSVEKVPNRLIFTGVMDFPPNFRSALWFIDKVLPLIRERRPDVVFTVAGMNPSPELLAKQSDHVDIKGFVENMNDEIAAAQLYVAPLVCGGGFKNKVMEAIANGTFVAGTPMAFEFLDQPLQSMMLIGETERELADRILEYLAAPERFDQRLEKAGEILKTSFPWSARARQIVSAFASIQTHPRG